MRRTGRSPNGGCAGSAPAPDDCSREAFTGTHCFGDVVTRAGAGGLRRAGVARGGRRVRRGCGERPAQADDHGRRAAAAFLVGDDVTCERAWDDAYRAAVEAGDRADGGAVRVVDRVLPASAGPDGAGQRLAHPVAAARRRGGRRVRGVRLPADPGASGCARSGSRRCARPGCAGDRDRLSARRRRPAGVRAPRPRPGPHRHGTDGRRVRLPRRRHAFGHRWRGRPDHRGRRVLRSDPRMHGAVRSGAGLGVDRSPRRVVRSPA